MNTSLKIKKSMAIPVSIFFLALVLRAVFIIFSFGQPFHGALEPSDSRVYNDFALSILNGKGFVNPDGTPASLRPPSYPLFLVGIYLLGGASNFILVQIIQTILSALTCVLIYLIAKTYFNQRVALLAGILSSVYLTPIVAATLLLTETLFIFILHLAIYLLIKSQHSWQKKIFAGILLGILILIKSQMIIFPLFIFFFFIILSWRNFKASLREYLPILFIPFLVISLWTIRNYVVFKKFLPTSTEGGLTLHLACHPLKGKIFGPKDKNDPVWQQSKLISSEVERDRYFYREAVKYIYANPRKVLGLIPLKLAYFFSPFDWEIMTGKEFNYLFIFSLPLAAFGMFSLRRRFKELRLLYLTIFFFIVLALIFFGTARYRLPIDFYLFIFASFVIDALFANNRKKVFFSLLLLSWFSLNFFAYLNTDFTKEALKRSAQRIRIW